MSSTRSSTKPGQHLLVIVLVLMILVVAGFIVRTAALRANAQRIAPLLNMRPEVSLGASASVRTLIDTTPAGA